MFLSRLLLRLLDLESQSLRRSIKHFAVGRLHALGPRSCLFQPTSAPRCGSRDSTSFLFTVSVPHSRANLTTSAPPFSSSFAVECDGIQLSLTDLTLPLQDIFIISCTLSGILVLLPAGNLTAIEAWFFGCSASTESGLNP